MVRSARNALWATWQSRLGSEDSAWQSRLGSEDSAWQSRLGSEDSAWQSRLGSEDSAWQSRLGSEDSAWQSRLGSEDSAARRRCHFPRLATLIVALAALSWGGCGDKDKSDDQKKADALATHYPKLPPKNVPAFMKGTIFELSDIDNRAPYLVSSYGLVVGLNGTGNNNGAPMAVRDYLVDQMVRHGIGSSLRDDRWRGTKPETVLQDPGTAIVEVYGFLPVERGAGSGSTSSSRPAPTARRAAWRAACFT